MHEIVRVSRYARRTLKRARKYARQRLREPDQSAAALFVLGAQRSGTTMLMDVLDEHPDTWIYQEYDRKAFQTDWRLRPPEVQQRLVAAARCRWVVFKPLFDVQHADRLFADHSGSKAVWIFRDYRGVARSSARKWGEAMREAVRRLAQEDPCSHWMADRLPAARKALLAELWHEAMSLDTAAALRWYLRNEILFDLDLLGQRDRVAVVRYEELVDSPKRAFADLFEFLELAFDDRAIADVSASSMQAAEGAQIDARVTALCDDLMGRLGDAASRGAAA